MKEIKIVKKYSVDDRGFFFCVYVADYLAGSFDNEEDAWDCYREKIKQYTPQDELLASTCIYGQ